MVVEDRFGLGLFQQQTALMVLVVLKVAVHSQAVPMRISKLVVVAVDQELMVLTQFHLMVEQAVQAFQILQLVLKHFMVAVAVAEKEVLLVRPGLVVVVAVVTVEKLEMEVLRLRIPAAAVVAQVVNSLAVQVVRV
jgi:hypothetical protein